MKAMTGADGVLQALSGGIGMRAGTGIGDFVFFRLIYDYFSREIDEFALALMERMMAWVTGIALAMVTLWVLVVGYRMVTGRMRESMAATMEHGARIALIVGLATTMSFLGSDLHAFLTRDLGKEIHALFTGHENRTAADSIDENLAYMQLALGAIDAVQVVEGDDEARERKARALLLAGFGTASPPMAAGTMLLLYQFTLAMFIGLGPLFILCLIFEQTKELFRKWLLYGIGTLFSMAMLSVVTAMAMKFEAKVAIALWVTKAVNGILGNDVEGLSAQAMQQCGIGLILTMLIITMPAAAAMFFQGTLAGFSYVSAFGGGPMQEARTRGGTARGTPAAPVDSSQPRGPVETSSLGSGVAVASAARAAGGQEGRQADTIKKVRG
jgi:type IV secretion system protein VirB6